MSKFPRASVFQEESATLAEGSYRGFFHWSDRSSTWALQETRQSMHTFSEAPRSQHVEYDVASIGEGQRVLSTLEYHRN